jgi:hydroxyacylglutathione hydrolase
MNKITPIRAFMDNYIWVIHGPDSHVALVDPGDAEPVLAYLEKEKLNPVAILITHHHSDHTGGIPQLLEHFDIPVYGPDDGRIPSVTHPLHHDDLVHLPELTTNFRVMEVPGHTRTHIAYYSEAVLFPGDTLFTCGCGRLFEGTPAQMQASLAMIRNLPTDTKIYCAHEYTLQNIDFARVAEPGNRELIKREDDTRRLRRAGQPTVPSTLALEMRTNPFLRWDIEELAQAAADYVGHPLDTAAEVFGALRRWKDDLD